MGGNLLLDTSKHHCVGIGINANHLRPMAEGFRKDMDCGRGRPWDRSDLEQGLAVWVDQSARPGLSGATVYPRQLLLSGLADALPAWEKAGTRTLLTSRP